MIMDSPGFPWIPQLLHGFQAETVQKIVAPVIVRWGRMGEVRHSHDAPQALRIGDKKWIKNTNLSIH
jgi:hypothetical protein